MRRTPVRKIKDSQRKESQVGLDYKENNTYTKWDLFQVDELYNGSEVALVWTIYEMLTFENGKHGNLGCAEYQLKGTTKI